MYINEITFSFQEHRKKLLKLSMEQSKTETCIDTEKWEPVVGKQCYPETLHNGSSTINKLNK